MFLFQNMFERFSRYKLNINICFFKVLHPEVFIYKYTWYTGLLFNRKQVDIRHIIYDKNTYLHKYINAQKYVYLICQTHLSGSDFTVTYLIEWFAYVM